MFYKNLKLLSDYKAVECMQTLFLKVNYFIMLLLALFLLINFKSFIFYRFLEKYKFLRILHFIDEFVTK